MKKTLFLVLASLSALTVHAGDSAPQVTVVPPTTDNSTMLTLQYGIMHTDCVEGKDALQLVPTLLHGASVSAQWKIAQDNKSGHYVGFSVGYYTNEQSDKYGSSMEEGTVSVVPLLLTYNYEYKLNDRLAVYAGLRGGAVVRDTTMHYVSPYYNASYDDTTVTPMLAVGVGARASLSENWALDIGYDFGYSFGEDCEIGQPDHPHSDYDYTRYASSPHNHRYYGTIKVGFSYSF